MRYLESNYAKHNLCAAQRPSHSVASQLLHASIFGAAEESRTLDLYLGKVSLYQLSYCRFLMLAEWTGLEPATPGVTGRYSNQLNYHSILLLHYKNFGSPTWARTRDLRINSPALYRLSYRGKEAHYKSPTKLCKLKNSKQAKYRLLPDPFFNRTRNN